MLPVLVLTAVGRRDSLIVVQAKESSSKTQQGWEFGTYEGPQHCAIMAWASGQDLAMGSANTNPIPPKLPPKALLDFALPVPKKKNPTKNKPKNKTKKRFMM